MPAETRARGKGQSTAISREPDVDSPKDKKSADAKVWNPAGLFADVVAGFVAWSLITHIVTLVFFFPLVKMAYTGGWEVFLVGNTVSAVLGFRPVRDFAARNYWAFRALGTTGLLCLFLETHEYRIALCAVGLTLEVTGIFGVWLTASDARRERSAYGFAIGLLVLISVRLAYFSYNPVWLHALPNLVTVGLSLVSTYILFVERNSFPIQPSHGAPADGVTLHWSRVGLGLCGSLFSFQHLFSTHAIVSRWADIPTFPQGVFVVLTLILGLLLSRHPIVNTTQWWLGTAGVGWFLFAAGLGGADGSQADWFPGWVQLLGGLLLALYTASTVLPVVDSVRRTSRPGRAFLFGMLVYLFYCLWSVYIVAYKFMDPVLSPILGQREKSLVFATVLAIGASHVRLGDERKTPRRRPDDAAPPMLVKTAVALVVCLVLAPAVTYRLHQASLPPSDPTPSEIKPFIWAIHFGYDNFGASSIDGIAKTMKEAGANIIGIVESDGTRIFVGNNDFTEYLGGALHFYTDYGPATSTMTWGCSMLTVFPILRSERIVMPSPFGELACLIDADLDINGTRTNVIVTHFGNTEDTIDLDLQTKFLAALFEAKREQFAPTIMIGYLTTPPYGPNWRTIMNAGVLDTLPSHDRYCEYILYKDLKLNSFVRIDKGNISDTEAQMASFSLLTDTSKTQTARHQKVTPGLCEKLKNDTVGCQAAEGCGWCQVSLNNRVGGCFEPTDRDSCLAFNGFWLGPEPETPRAAGDQRQMIKDLAERLLHYQLDGSYGDSLVRQLDDSYLWTIPRLEKVDRQSRLYDSPVFPAGDHYWRAKITVPWHFRGDNRSTWFGAFVSRVHNVVDDERKDDVTADVELTLVNQLNPDLSRKNSFTGEFNYTTTDRGFPSIVDWHALNTEGFKKEDNTIQLVVKISERFKTHLA